MSTDSIAYAYHEFYREGTRQAVRVRNPLTGVPPTKHAPADRTYLRSRDDMSNEQAGSSILPASNCRVKEYPVFRRLVRRLGIGYRRPNEGIVEAGAFGG